MTCLRCAHKWHPKKEKLPLCCAFCKSPYWNTAPDKTSSRLADHQKKCKACR